MGIQKAIAALITNLVVLLSSFGIDAAWLTPELVASISMILSTFIVYIVPNKDTNKIDTTTSLVLILPFVIFLASCATVNDTPQTQAEKHVKQALGWNSVLNLYYKEIKNCTPVKTWACIIEPDDTLIVDQAVKTYAAARETCLNQPLLCNACTLSDAIASIANVLNADGYRQFTTACIGNSEIDTILEELGTETETQQETDL